MPAENPRATEVGKSPSRPHKRFVQAVDNAFRPNPGNKMQLPSRDGVSQIIFSSERQLDPRLYISRTTPAADGSQEFIIANLTHDPKDHSSYNANGIRIRAKTREKRDGQREVIEVLGQDRVTATLSRPAGKTIYDAPPPRWKEQKDQPKPKDLRTKTRLARKYQEDPRDRRTKTVIKTAAVVTIAAAIAAPAINITSDSTNQPRETPTIATQEQEQVRYVEISAADLAAVETIVNNSAGLPEIPYNHDLPKPWDTKIDLEAQRQMDAAERLGLTVFDYHAAGGELWSDAYEKETPQLPFNLYFDTAKDFLAQYGIPLSLEIQGDDKQIPLTPSMLEEPQVKKALLFLIQDFGQLPKELVETMGITEIKLANVMDARHGGFARGTTIYIDPFTVNAPGKLLHEGYHVFDHTHPYQEGQYGFQFLEYNPGFTRENPLESYGKFYLGDYPDENYSYISLGHLSTLEFNYELAVIRGDQEKATALQNKIQEKGKIVATTSDYGFFDDLEDKAEIGSMLLTPGGLQRVLNPEHTILYNKSLLLLTRFYQEDPRLVQYLADISIQQEETT